MNAHNFFAELKRRHVYRVAIAYGVGTWLFIQVATQVFPLFEIPNWIVRLVVLVPILAFPIALRIACAFHSTPESISLAQAFHPNPPIPRWSSRAFAQLVTSVG